MSGWLQLEWNALCKWVRGLFRRRKLNFITIHYIYLISWAIVGSILIYPAGELAYIDALFFACGATTQSGLNTVNVNDIHTSQQVMLYLIPMFTNPIVIHGTVIFVRLYWFEKRFQHVVKEAVSWKRSRTRSMGQQTTREKPLEDEERGVQGRSIVMLDDGHAVGGNEMKERAENKEQNGAARVSSSGTGTDDESNGSHGSRESTSGVDKSKREVLFADQVSNSPRPIRPVRLPEPRSADQHIAFLERQRNPDDKSALRIPGPRDFDRGKLPERIDAAEDNDLIHERTSSTSRTHNRQRRYSDGTPRPQSARELNRNITIDDSARPPSSRQPRPNTSHIVFRRTNTGGSSAVEDGDVPAPPRPRPRARSTTFTSFIKSTSTYHEPGPVPYLSWQPTVGRNSAFIDLTEDQREELGGIEYRSLKTLAIVVTTYFLFFHLLGVVCLVPWILRTNPWNSIVASDGMNLAWWGIFSSSSLFNDVGFTLTPDSFNSFQTAVLPLFLGSFLIVIGNTGFPCMLRLWIWLLQKVVPENSPLWEELRFLLDHPRRCFTLLFPSSATWVLFAILVLMNGIDLIFFIILDINDVAVDTLSPGFQVLNGLFQATSTRTAGTSVVNLAELHPGIQVSYLIMMYISVFPIAISMRRTNVYEERSLGVYSSHDEEDEEDGRERSYIGAHLRNQLSFDLWFIFLGLFIIAIAEGQRIADANEPAFDLFSCLFEIVSAYGTVGLSLGYPNIDASFSTEFSVVSKLVICLMMIRGRHRGLPYEVDRAILLPSENLHRKEDEDAVRRNRRLSGGSFQQAGSIARSTGADAGDGGILTSRRPRRQSLPRVRDAPAKVTEGLAHADSMVKEEVARHTSADSG